MAALRPVEERDKAGNTLRVNPSITFTQNPQIRTIIGRHDYRLEPNPDYHEVITAQVQDNVIRFFHGTPETTLSRRAAREVNPKDVPAYIINSLKKNPIKVREQRPMVYEVRVATIDGQETPVVDEVYSNDGMSITVTPVEPDINPRQTEDVAPASPRQGKRSRMPESLKQVAEHAEGLVE